MVVRVVGGVVVGGVVVARWMVVVVVTATVVVYFVPVEPGVAVPEDVAAALLGGLFRPDEEHDAINRQQAVKLPSNAPLRVGSFRSSASR